MKALRGVESRASKSPIVLIVLVEVERILLSFEGQKRLLDSPASQIITSPRALPYSVKIYFPHTSTRIAQLHALGFTTHPDHPLVPLVGLDKKHRIRLDEVAKPDEKPEWHQLVTLGELNLDRKSSPYGVWLDLVEQRAASRTHHAQAA